jgi:large repetitive protein
MGMLETLLRRHSGRCAAVVAAAIAVGVVLAGGASGALKVPVPIGPANGAAVGAMPAFAWAPVAGAKEYEVQVAADSGFNSPVLGGGKDDFRTKNTRATLIQTAPNGTYWWRVRAVGKNGTPSGWSQGRSFRKSWASRTTLVSPVGGAPITYPATPLKLTWQPVPGARKYLVSVATDPALGSLITISGGTRPIETSATTFTPAAALAPGTYYWGITALDAEGNRGVPSAVGSFTWVWPSATAPQVTDLSASPELFDPRFSWNPVPGAARYEVEINST